MQTFKKKYNTPQIAQITTLLSKNLEKMALFEVWKFNIVHFLDQEQIRRLALAQANFLSRWF